MTARLNAFINRYGWPTLVGLTLVIIPGVAGLLKDFFELKGELKSLKTNVEIIRSDDLPEIKEELQSIHKRLFHLGLLKAQEKNSPDVSKKTISFFLPEVQMGQERPFCPVKRVDSPGRGLLGFLGSFPNNYGALLCAEAHPLYILVQKDPFLPPIVHVKSFVCQDVVLNKIIRPVAFTSQKQGPVKVSSKIIEIRGMRAGYQVKTPSGRWVTTPKGDPYAQILDVGKKHSGGVPVHQIKWFRKKILSQDDWKNG